MFCVYRKTIIVLELCYIASYKVRVALLMNRREVGSERFSMEKNVLPRMLLMFFSLCVLVLGVNVKSVEAAIDADLNDDGVVDFRDVALAAWSFGSRPGHERWNPDADLNQNGEVDIGDILAIVRYMRLHETRGSVEPEALTAILRPGESVTETKNVTFSCAYDFDLGTLKLKASEGYENWLINVSPAQYAGVSTNAGPYVFEVTVEVPENTDPGFYSFQIIAYTSGGESAEEAYQDVVIEVPPSQVIPDVPFGTILASALMVAALAAYVTVPKWRRKLNFTR